MFTNLCLVGIGGAAGCILRYLCQRWLNPGAFPYGTLLVNVAGSFVIGLLMGWFSRHWNEQLRLLLVSGFCGGFTTFSSFAYENVELLSGERWMSFVVYTAISVAAGITVAFLGYKLSS